MNKKEITIDDLYVGACIAWKESRFWVLAIYFGDLLLSPHPVIDRNKTQPCLTKADEVDDFLKECVLRPAFDRTETNQQPQSQHNGS